MKSTAKLRDGIRALSSSRWNGSSHLVRVEKSEARLPLTHCGREVLGDSDEGSRLAYFSGTVAKGDQIPSCSICYWRWEADHCPGG